MNERAIEKLSDNLPERKIAETREISVWNDGVQESKEIRFYENDNRKEYYYVFLQGDASYIISVGNFERIMSAIQDGAKFLQINDDLVNVNQIRRFKKTK